jgi:hypothetical protein
MQHIQDKDFDQLFKDRFEDAEIQPSAGLWSNIKKEIEPKKQRKLPVRWMAAASVLVTLSVLLFFNKTEKIQLHGKAAMVSNEPKAVEAVLDSINDPILESNPAVQATKPYNRPKEAKSLLVMQPVASQTHLNNMEPIAKPLETIKPVSEELPMAEVALASVENQAATGNQTAAMKEEPAAIKEEGAALNTEITESSQPARTRIRNAGDLLNFVVDKLDKREEKIIQFETDEDDNSSLVAINIGPFKFNSRKHK